jgi:membrane protease YdiL (CAAX protease family)
MDINNEPHGGPQPKNEKRTWTGRQALFISILSYFVAQIVVAVPIVIIGIANGGEVDDELLDQPWLSLVLTGVSAGALLATLVLFFRYKRISIKKLGFKKPKAQDLALVPLVYIVYVFILATSVGIISALYPSFDPEQAQQVGFVGAAGWQLLLAFIGLVVIAPVAEEMLFRGFLYKGLKRRSGPRLLIYFGLALALVSGAFAGAVAAAVVALLSLLSAAVITNNTKLGAAIFTSMLFGLVHMQWNVAVDTFILSFALIWILEKTGNLWPAIFLHALKNCVAFVFVFGIVSLPGV